MKLSRIEIFGFKSFRDRFLLNFDTPLVGVVGPNGCGKSNIVDALRWVLGETHAKQLRGGVQEDLIFNGAEGAKAMGMAEVSVCFKNDGIDVETASNNPFSSFLSSSEIEFTRRLYRSGESEYFINKTPCRLKDMTDLFRIVGLGARGLSIVQQGTIGELVTKKPVERRELIEEAAGIAGFRKRIEEASRKLARSQENLGNLDQVITEVESQVRYLNRQAKKAERKKVITEELSQVDRELFEKRSKNLLFQYHSASQELEEVNQTCTQSSAKESTCRAHESEHRARLETVNQEAAQLKSRRQQIVSKQAELRALLDEKSSVLAESELNCVRLEESLKAREDKLVALNKRVGLLSDEIVAATSKAEELAEKLRGLRQTEEALGAELAALVEKNQKELSDYLGGVHFSSSVDEEERTRLSESLRSVEGKLSEVRSQREEKRSALREAQARLGQLEVTVAKKESALASTNEFLERKLHEHKKHVPTATENEKLLIQGITCKPELRTAVSAVLGDKSGYLVSEDPLKFLEAADKKPGSGVISAKLASSARKGTLLEHLEIEEWARPVAEHFLGDVFLASNAQEAWQKVENSDGIAVTRDGVVVSQWGWCVPGREDLEFELKEKLNTLETEIKNSKRALVDQKNAVDCINNELEGLQETLAKNQRVRDSIQQEREVLSKKLEEQNQRHQELLRKERQLRDAHVASERELQVKIGQIKSEIALGSGRLESEKSRLESLRQDQELTSEQCTVLGKEIESDKESLLELKDEQEVRAKMLKDEISSSDEKAELELAEHRLQEIEALISTNDEERGALLKLLSEAANSAAEANRELKAASERKSQIDLAREKFVVELRYLYDEKWDDDILSRSGEEVQKQEISELATRAAELRHSLERIGEVSFDSLEEYQAQKARLDSLIEQREDLINAKTKLEETIADLKEISRNRFRETFDFVSKKFEEFAPILFGGGSGSMTIIDSEDPLECGVELSVRPPGKKIRSLELLSGGEKALAATAVILSIFLYKPSPICVLDEVDAPLDDANLERFLSVIKDISDTTQFLVVTHNKQTMAAVGRLVGITMEEKGVSKAVHLDLALAEKEIDRLVAS